MEMKKVKPWRPQINYEIHGYSSTNLDTLTRHNENVTLQPIKYKLLCSYLLVTMTININFSVKVKNDDDPPPMKKGKE